MSNYRILNRIVLINIANVKYTDIELNGNTCFVGANNYGKTSLQRAILFFYSANSRALGISSSQKPFEEHYFRYDNSYIIYEVATETSPFFVMVYRHNKLVFRFVNSEYNPEFFFNENNEALKFREVLANLDKRNIFYSNQIDTFEKYRNILYGTETDPKLNKFFLLRGNEKYQNIPKSITNVFLSSKNSIDSRFIKDFIASAISNESDVIQLENIERQLRQFSEKHQDIETFLKKETQQLIELAEQKYDQVQVLKTAQLEAAEKLGSTLRYADTQHNILMNSIQEKENQLKHIKEEYEALKYSLEERQKDIREQIGFYDGMLREAQRKLDIYKEKNIDEILEKYQEKQQLESRLQVLQKEYDALTSDVQNVEVQYQSLLNEIRNEIQSVTNKINAQITEVVNHYNELILLQKEEQNKRESALKQQLQSAISSIDNDINQKQIELAQLKSEEKISSNIQPYEKEIKQLELEITELKTKIYTGKSELAIRQNQVDTLQKEWQNLEKQLQQKFENITQNIQKQIEQLKKEIAQIDEKLNIQENAFYGFLEKNVPNWHLTFGKILNEDILFKNDLNPQLVNPNDNTIFGVQVDLDKLQIVSKSIEQYQTEKINKLNQIKELENQYLQEQQNIQNEKLLNADKYGKQIAEIKEDIKVTQYAIELAEKKERKLLIELEEWKSKAAKETDASLHNIREKIAMIEEELSILKKRKQITEAEFDTQIQNNIAKSNQQIQHLKQQQQKEIEQLEVQRKNTIKELKDKEEKLIAEKQNIFQNKGVDNKKIQEIQKQISELQEQLAEIQQYQNLINDYLKDKRDLFDNIPVYKQKKEEYVTENKNILQQIEDATKKYNLERLEIQKQKKELEDNLYQFNQGILFFQNNFKETPVYKHYASIIENAEPKPSQYNITDLCTQLLKNESYFNEEATHFQRYINEFAGKFRQDNHFGFYIRNDATFQEYEKFAQNLRSFINENRIDVSITETSALATMIIDSIAIKVKELSGQKDKIQHIVSLLADDFKKAEFEESKLIEYIKIRLEESDNKIYKILKKIQEFRDEHGIVFNDGLFNTENNTPKKSLSLQIIRMLDQLRSAIKEQEQQEIRLQDLFELKFNIKEGLNETGWTHRIDSIGSTGTDILVKAIIYITLLHVFIKESSVKTNKSFKVHCIIDEVGQISAHYLRELLRFAKSRDIVMINGLPNKSGLESHYKYTYQFKKDEDGSVRIFPSIVTEVEV
ncbi:MAG: ATP-binding protein [Bacteroidia bacterium]